MKDYNEDAIIERLKFQYPQPAIVSGRCYSDNEEGGHAWIIDGLLEQKRNVTEYKQGVAIKWVENRTLFHVNYGWAGSYDGYFYPGVFDLREEPPFKEGDFDDGNASSANTYFYKMGIMIYSYGRRTDIL